MLWCMCCGLFYAVACMYWIVVCIGLLYVVFLLLLLIFLLLLLFTGGGMTRGVSGGERKRTNIGVELIGNPSILFLDEPTSVCLAHHMYHTHAQVPHTCTSTTHMHKYHTHHIPLHTHPTHTAHTTTHPVPPPQGLDAFQAFNVMSSLWSLAQAGRTVLATVHQPRSSIFQMFDLLMLITKGRMVYFGAAHDAVCGFCS